MRQVIAVVTAAAIGCGSGSGYLAEIATAADAEVAKLADCLETAGRGLTDGDSTQVYEWLRCIEAGTWEPVRVMGRAPAVDEILARYTPRLDALVDGALGEEHSHEAGEGHGHLLAGNADVLTPWARSTSPRRVIFVVWNGGTDEDVGGNARRRWGECGGICRRCGRRDGTGRPPASADPAGPGVLCDRRPER